MKYRVTIEFCMQWNYAPKAASFAEALFNHFRHQIESLELVPGSGGVFEVTVNGNRIHSKKESGQYPEVDSFIIKMEGKTFE